MALDIFVRTHHTGVMNDPNQITHDRPLTHIAHVRRRELRGLSRQLQAAEIEVRKIRDKLDRSLYRWQQDGTSITDLSLDSGLSRETVYRSINRVRADLGSEPVSEKDD
jgi:hypothetical protein